jgi:hypothetical protein
MIVKKPRLKFAVAFLLGVFGIVISADADVAAEAETPSLQDKLIWNGTGGFRYADLSPWNQTVVTKAFGKPTEVFSLDKAGQSKIKQWVQLIPKDADTVWRYLPKNGYPLVERIIFLRKDTPLMVIQRESDW